MSSICPCMARCQCSALRRGCPEVEFIPVTIETSGDARKALDLNDEVDGYFVYVATLSWSLGSTLSAIGKLNKPMVVGNEFLGGCGAFLGAAPPLVHNAKAAAVSSCHRKGQTVAPPAVATSTEVVKEKTSTMTTTSLSGASSSMPRGPHSQRMSNSDWSYMVG